MFLLATQAMSTTCAWICFTWWGFINVGCIPHGCRSHLRPWGSPPRSWQTMSMHERHDQHRHGLEATLAPRPVHLSSSGKAVRPSKLASHSPFPQKQSPTMDAAACALGQGGLCPHGNANGCRDWWDCCSPSPWQREKRNSWTIVGVEAPKRQDQKCQLHNTCDVRNYYIPKCTLAVHEESPEDAEGYEQHMKSGNHSSWVQIYHSYYAGGLPLGGRRSNSLPLAGLQSARKVAKYCSSWPKGRGGLWIQHHAGLWLCWWLLSGTFEAAWSLAAISSVIAAVWW